MTFGCWCVFFFFQAEDGIRDLTVTGVQTCALPILSVTSVIFTRGLRARSCRGCSSRGQMRPQRVGAALGDRAPELGGPVALAAEFGAPRPETPRRELQRVLVREANRAVHLVSDLGADARGLADPHLGDGDLERGVAAVGSAERVRGRRARGG